MNNKKLMNRSRTNSNDISSEITLQQN
jgi:hypothetical protein